jgi:hypothetical protein
MDVVNEQIRFRDSAPKLHNFQLQSIQTDPFVLILAKNERLAMFQVDRSFFPNFAFGKVLESTVIEDVAILKNLYKGNSLVLCCLGQHDCEVFDVHIDRTRHKSRFICQSHAEGVYGIVDGPLRSGLGLLAKFRRRGILPFRQSVNSVVKKDKINIDVPTNDVHEMIPSDAEGVTVAGNNPDRKVRP